MRTGVSDLVSDLDFGIKQEFQEVVMSPSVGRKIQMGGDRVLQQRKCECTGLEGSRRDGLVHQEGGVWGPCV